jgi:hypothetical protein
MFFCLILSGISPASADEVLPTLYEVQLIKAEAPASRDYFGWNLALQHDTAVIAKADGDTHRLAAIYRYAGGRWELLKTVSASVIPEDGTAPEIDIDGDILLLSEDSHDESDDCTPDGHCGDTGLVYVFERDLGGTNNWGLRTTLNGGHKVGAGFGGSLAVDGETAAIAAAGEDGGAATTRSNSKSGINPDHRPAAVTKAVTNSGAIYLFERNKGGPDQWGLVQKLEAENLVEWGLFGAGLMLAGDTLITQSAPGLFETRLNVYQRGMNETSPWSLVQEIEVPVARIRHSAFDGETLVHSSFNEDTQLNTYYFYERGQEVSWQLVQTLQNVPGQGDLKLDREQLIERITEPSEASDIVARIFEKNPDTDQWVISGNIGVSTVETPERVWAVAIDNGRFLVSGWSETEANNREGEVFAYEFTIPINVGHAGAWFNAATSGQGQLIDIEPASKFMFLSWFTYTAADSDNPFEQHWFTAQGNYVGNKADLVVYETLDGKFDDSQPVNIEPVGNATLTFTDCGFGRMNYAIDTLGLSGSFPLQRAIQGSDDICQQQQAITTKTEDINGGMDGAWFDENTPGQGYLIDAHPDPEGGNFIFVAWFTYGDDTASGQRWLTAQGSFEGSTAAIDVSETTGGSFDESQAVSTEKVGTMTIDFQDCSNALLSYELTDEALRNSIAISRAIPGAQALCEELAAAD